MDASTGKTETTCYKAPANVIFVTHSNTIVATYSGVSYSLNSHTRKYIIPHVHVHCVNSHALCCMQNLLTFCVSLK